MPNPRRINQKLSSLLHLQPETENSNLEFVYPFKSRLISNDPYNYYNNYRHDDVRFPGELPGRNFVKPHNPGIDAFEPDKVLGQPKNGLTFADFIIKYPSTGVGTGKSENNSENKYGNKPSDPNLLDSITNKPVFDETTQKPHFDEVYKPGFSNHSVGLIMGSVSNEPAFGSEIVTVPDTERAPVFETSSKPGFTVVSPNFGERNGEEETTLATLTPVPPSVSRHNINFGPAGIFSKYIMLLCGACYKAICAMLNIDVGCMG